MDKEEILKRSRNENKNQDVYEKEVITKGGDYGAVAAAVLATVLFILQILLGQGMNYGLYAIVFVIPAVRFIYKAIKMKNKHEIFVAALYSVATVCASVACVIDLIGNRR